MFGKLKVSCTKVNSVIMQVVICIPRWDLILSGDEDGLFEVADKTGILSLLCHSKKGLDRESKDRYFLKVTVTDMAGHEVGVTPW